MEASRCAPTPKSCSRPPRDDPPLLTYGLAGMHKHFRMLAIAEYMRSHGYDPAIYTHLRIPGLWKKLNEFFNMPMIDDRENTMDVIQDPTYDDQFKPFDLPWDEYGELIMQRAVADPNNEGPSSPAELLKSPASSKKRRRGEPAGGHHPKTRSSTVEDSEAENEDVEEARPSSGRKSARSARSAKRAASKKVEEEEIDEEEAEEEEESSEQEEEESEEEEEVPAAKTTRGPGRGWKRGRARARGGRRR